MTRLEEIGRLLLFLGGSLSLAWFVGYAFGRGLWLAEQHQYPNLVADPEEGKYLE